MPPKKKSSADGVEPEEGLETANLRVINEDAPWSDLTRLGRQFFLWDGYRAQPFLGKISPGDYLILKGRKPGAIIQAVAKVAGVSDVEEHGELLEEHELPDDLGLPADKPHVKHRRLPVKEAALEFHFGSLFRTAATGDDGVAALRSILAALESSIAVSGKQNKQNLIWVVFEEVYDISSLNWTLANLAEALKITDPPQGGRNGPFWSRAGEVGSKATGPDHPAKAGNAEVLGALHKLLVGRDNVRKYVRGANGDVTSFVAEGQKWTRSEADPDRLIKAFTDTLAALPGVDGKSAKKKKSKAALPEPALPEPALPEPAFPEVPEKSKKPSKKASEGKMAAGPTSGVRVHYKTISDRALALSMALGYTWYAIFDSQGTAQPGDLIFFVESDRDSAPVLAVAEIGQRAFDANSHWKDVKANESLLAPPATPAPGLRLRRKFSPHRHYLIQALKEAHDEMKFGSEGFQLTRVWDFSLSGMTLHGALAGIIKMAPDGRARTTTCASAEECLKLLKQGDLRITERFKDRAMRITPEDSNSLSLLDEALRDSGKAAGVGLHSECKCR